MHFMFTATEKLCYWQDMKLWVELNYETVYIDTAHTAIDRLNLKCCFVNLRMPTERYTRKILDFIRKMKFWEMFEWFLLTLT